jgi:hypothetical protein
MGVVPVMITDAIVVIPAPPEPEMTRPKMTCHIDWPAPLRLVRIISHGLPVTYTRALQLLARFE